MSSVIMLPQAALAALEGAINAVLALDPETVARLRPLEGKVVALSLEGTSAVLYLLPGADGFRLMGRFEGEPDTTLAGTPLALLRLGRSGTGAGLFGGAVTIAGDVALGQQVQRILGGLDIDWEEHLSHLLGDPIAHQLGNMARGILQWGGQAVVALQRDGIEYLQEERRDLPPRWEVDEFLAGVDQLRSGVDRLTARIERLLR